MSILPACIGVGGQPIARKSRLREFTLSLGAFNLRMQALRQLQPLNTLPVPSSLSIEGAPAMQSTKAPSHKFEFSFLNGNLMVPADPLLILSRAGGEREPPSVDLPST